MRAVQRGKQIQYSWSQTGKHRQVYRIQSGTKWGTGVQRGSRIRWLAKGGECQRASGWEMGADRIIQIQGLVGMEKGQGRVRGEYLTIVRMHLCICIHLSCRVYLLCKSQFGTAYFPLLFLLSSSPQQHHYHSLTSSQCGFPISTSSYTYTHTHS